MSKVMIFNASTLHRSSENPIWNSLFEFAFLLRVQAAGGCADDVARLFAEKGSWASNIATLPFLRMAIHVYRSKPVCELIENYKLGRIEAREFLDDLAKHVFQDITGISFPRDLKQRIFEEKDSYLCFKDEEINSVDDLSANHVARALLESAWTVRIRPYDNEFKRRIDQLRTESVADVSEFDVISNSNTLDMARFLDYAHKAYPADFVDPKDIDWGAKNKIQIATINGVPVYLLTSFTAKLMKTSGQVKQSVRKAIPDADTFGTNCLIGVLVKDLEEAGVRTGDMVLVSQWRGDLKQAKSSGITAIAANSYFNVRSIRPGQTLAVGSVAALMAYLTTWYPDVAATLFSLSGLAVDKYVYSMGDATRSVLTGMLSGTITGNIVQALPATLPACFSLWKDSQTADDDIAPSADVAGPAM